MIAWLLASAWAAEVALSTPFGPLPIGRPGVVEVVVAEGGVPVTAAVVELIRDGANIGRAEAEAPGRYRMFVEAADDRAIPIVVRVDGVPSLTTTIPVEPALVGVLGEAVRAPGMVGAERIEVRFPLRGAVDARWLNARVSEGRVLDVRVDADAVVVGVQPGDDRTARVMAVALVDGRLPGIGPRVVAVQLRARQTASVNVGAGSSVIARVGRRSYGPFSAGADGLASITFDVFPGETSVEMLATDDVGNSRKVTSPLPTVGTPTLVGIEVPTGVDTLPDLFLAAWTPAGAAWAGETPTCRSGVGGREAAWPVADGLYRYRPATGGAVFDLRVECALDAASASFRLPVPGGRASRLEVKVYPDALSADFPFAEIQAVLVDERGGRLPSDRVSLSARTGTLDTRLVDGVVRAAYAGTAAAPSGGDVITASWRPPPGAGEPWDLDLHAASTTFGNEVRVRARDRAGNPIPGVVVSVGPRGGPAEDVVTGGSGWGAAVFPTVPQIVVIEARAGHLTREQVVIPGEVVALPETDRPDLYSEVEVPIRAGQVRQMYIDVAPRPLVTGTGDTAVIEVRMLDAGGNPVRGEEVVISADVGVIAQTNPRPDGSMVAVYTPPAGSASRTVHISAQSAGGSVATDLQLVPRPVRGGVSVAGGWATNFGAISAPCVDVAVQNRLPILPELLQLRVGVGTYTMDTTVPDVVTGGEVHVRAQFVPIELGIAASQRVGRRVLDAGMSAVLLPVVLSGDFDGVRGVAGSGLGPPGFLFHGGGGLRFGNSEVFGEVRYLLAASRGGTISFQGSVGGGSLVAGYRVLY